jgi:hypothetical protein
MEAKKVINEALLCRMFKCRPSELEHEDSQKLQLFMSIYTQLGEKNPFIMM